MRVCFTDVFFFVFSVRHKNTRQPFSGTAERIFMRLLPNDSGENVVSNVVPKWGLGPPINFLGLKTTHFALGGDAWRVTENISLLAMARYWCRRLANHSEKLVHWLWHCAAMVVALKKS